MNLKKSWVNIPLFKNIIKQNTVLAKISLLAVVAFSIMGVFGGSNVIPALLFGISSVVLTTCYAGIVQKYMTNKTEANFMASLPIDSFVLWFTHYIAGLVLVVVPLWIEALLMTLLMFLLQGNGYWFLQSPDNYLFTFQLVTVVLAIIYYTMSFFVSCIAGNRLGQFLYTAVVYAIPFSVYLVIVSGGEALAIGNGFLMDGINDALYLFVPFASGMQCLEGNGWSYALIHCIITILFFIGGYYVFKNRSIENTGSAIMYKKVNVILRAIVVVTISLFIFILLMIFINVVPNGHIRSILLGGCIFVVLGCLMALLAEIIFKNPHVYKSLCYYVPILVFSYIGCYMYGNYSYENVKEDIFLQDKVSMMVMAHTAEQYNNYNDGEFVQIDSKDVKQFVAELEKKPEKLYKEMGLSRPRDSIAIIFHLTNEEERQRQSFTLIIDSEYFDKVSRTMPEMFKKSVDETTINRIINAKEEYWVLSDNNNQFGAAKDILNHPFSICALLTKQEVLSLCEYINSDKYQENTNLFTKKYQLVTDDEVFTLALDYEFIETFTQDKKITQRTTDMQQCYQDIYDADGKQFDTVLALYPQLVSREATRVESFNALTDYQVIDDTTATLNVRYQVYETNDDKPTIVPCKITFTRQDDEMIVSKVERGESK